jgi:hypothetical protein
MFKSKSEIITMSFPIATFSINFKTSPALWRIIMKYVEE